MILEQEVYPLRLVMADGIDIYLDKMPLKEKKAMILLYQNHRKNGYELLIQRQRHNL